MNNNIIKFGIIILIFLITAILSSSSYAETITLTDAFLTALNNNIELKEKANEIKKLEKDLEIIKAQQSWNIELNGEYNKFLNETENISLKSTYDNTVEGGRAVINIEKEFASGLRFNQELSYSENDEDNYHISFIQPLLPTTESSLEEEYFLKSKELLIKSSEYISLKEDKIIDWVESYLNILRLEKTLNNLKRSAVQAKNYYENIKEKAAVEEAGENELLTAEIAYLDAENEYLDIKDQFLNTKKAFILSLGLEKDKNIIYDKNVQILEFLRNIIVDYEQKNIEDIYNKLLSADNDLKIEKLNLVILEKTLDWAEDDSKFNLDFNGSYDQSSEESMLGLSISYDFYDGGADKLRQQKIVDDIKLQNDRLVKLEKDKLLQLENSINKINSAERLLKRNNLSLIKAEHELDIRKEQYSDGLAAEIEVLESEIDYYSSLNEYHKSRDQLLIEELNLVKIISDKIINTERWRDKDE